MDNAKPHLLKDDPDVMLACKRGGWDIRLRYQPPNSPDLNVLDLGYFRALQSVQYRSTCFNANQLIAAVNTAFDTMPANTLNSVFLTLQAVMELIMKHDGGNTFKLPHL